MTPMSGNAVVDALAVVDRRAGSSDPERHRRPGRRAPTARPDHPRCSRPAADDDVGVQHIRRKIPGEIDDLGAVEDGQRDRFPRRPVEMRYITKLATMAAEFSEKSA